MDSKGKLNIYKVSGDELRAIAGIGKGTAKAIIDLQESVPVITEEHLNTIAQLRNNEEFWAVIDLLPPQKVNFETPPTVSLYRAEGDIVRPRWDSLRGMPDIDTPSSRALLTEPDVDRGVDTPKRDQGGSMSSKRLFFGMSQDNTLNKNLGSPRQPKGERTGRRRDRNRGVLGNLVENFTNLSQAGGAAIEHGVGETHSKDGVPLNAGWRERVAHRRNSKRPGIGGIMPVGAQPQGVNGGTKSSTSGIGHK